MTLDDRPVRARTRPGRLAVTERWLAQHEPALLAPGSRVIDFGFGETPVTTLEWAAALSPQVTVIAVEREASRVDAARSHGTRLTLVHGGFEALPSLAPVTAVRAMNVLRAYPLEQIADAHRALAAPLIEGGLVIEGSTDVAGDLTVAHVLRKRGPDLLREHLLFHTTFAHGFAPRQFRDHLPRDLRRSVKPGTRLFDFLRDWHSAFEQTRGELSSRFAQSLAALGPEVSSWESGALQWSPAGGVPRAQTV